MKHRFPCLFVVHRRRAARAAHRPAVRSHRVARRVVAHAAVAFRSGSGAVHPFFFAEGEVGGYAVGHGDELDEQEVQAGYVDKGVEGGGFGGRVGGGGWGLCHGGLEARSWSWWEGVAGGYGSIVGVCWMVGCSRRRGMCEAVGYL